MAFLVFLIVLGFTIGLYRLISTTGIIDKIVERKPSKTQRIKKIHDLVDRDWASIKTNLGHMQMDPDYWLMKNIRFGNHFHTEFGFCTEVVYKFENGYKLYFYDGNDRRKIILRGRTSEKITEFDFKKGNDAGEELWSRLRDIRIVCMQMREELQYRSRQRAYNKYEEYRQEQEWHNQNGRAYSGATSSTNNDEYSGLDPKKADKLRKLDEKIKLRQEQINRMQKGSDRDSLVNELDNYKRARERMMKV